MKEIILFTIPHTGTHTVQYLFSHLMGIKVWWGHFEEQNTRFLDQILDRTMDPERFVHVQTWRSYQSMEESFKSRKRYQVDKRKQEDGDDRVAESLKYFDGCLDVRAQYGRRLSRKLGYPSYINIEAPASHKSVEARAIFSALGVEPSGEALTFLDEWPRINSHHELHNNDRKDKAQLGIKSSHIKLLLRQLHKEENDHGT